MKIKGFHSPVDVYPCPPPSRLHSQNCVFNFSRTILRKIRISHPVISNQIQPGIKTELYAPLLQLLSKGLLPYLNVCSGRGRILVGFDN